MEWNWISLQRMVQKRETIQWSAFLWYLPWYLHNFIVTSRYNEVTQNTISECTTYQNLKQMGYVSRGIHCMPLLSAKNIKLRLQFTLIYQNWTTEDWKSIVWSDECWILLLRLDWCKPHEHLDPSCLVSVEQAVV